MDVISVSEMTHLARLREHPPGASPIMIYVNPLWSKQPLVHLNFRPGSDSIQRNIPIRHLPPESLPHNSCTPHIDLQLYLVY